MYYLYIIQSLGKVWRYIGISDDPLKRLKEHNAGITTSTKPYRPFKLVHTESYPDKTEARKRELFLKKNYKAREEIYKTL